MNQFYIITVPSGDIVVDENSSAADIALAIKYYHEANWYALTPPELREWLYNAKKREEPKQLDLFE